MSTSQHITMATGLCGEPADQGEMSSVAWPTERCKEREREKGEKGKGVGGLYVCICVCLLKVCKAFYNQNWADIFTSPDQIRKATATNVRLAVLFPTAGHVQLVLLTWGSQVNCLFAFLFLCLPNTSFMHLNVCPVCFYFYDYALNFFSTISLLRFLPNTLVTFTTYTLAF